MSEAIMDRRWAKIGDDLFMVDRGTDAGNLGKGIYRITSDPIFGLGLHPIGRKFNFNHKLYNVQDKLITHIVKTFKVEKANLGIILNGVKGSGKTVTAKVLANAIDLPSILVTHQYPTLPDFLNDVNEPVTVIFDEYEKIYPDYDKGPNILQVMDGILNTSHRRVFILTTNNLYINGNMLNRPGRLRYRVQFGNLPKNVTTEIIDDLLKYPEHREATIDFCSKLQEITIDIVGAIVREVNIHNMAPQEFASFFNVDLRQSQWNVYVENQTGPATNLSSYCSVWPAMFTESAIGRNFEINGDFVGKIKEVGSDLEATIQRDEESDPIYWKGNRRRTMNIKLERVAGLHPHFLPF